MENRLIEINKSIEGVSLIRTATLNNHTNMVEKVTLEIIPLNPFTTAFYKTWLNNNFGHVINFLSPNEADKAVGTPNEADKAVGTIDLTPSWERTIMIITELYQSLDEDGQKQARGIMMQCARVADAHVSMLNK